MKKTKTASKKAAVKKVSSTKTASRLVFLSRHLRSVIIASGVIAVLLVFWSYYSAKADNVVSPFVYNQGFEGPQLDQADPQQTLLNSYDWYLDTNPQKNGVRDLNMLAVRQKAGTNPMPASLGSYYGLINKGYSFSSFGDSCIADSVPDAWLTQIDVYLDLGWQVNQGFKYAVQVRKNSTPGDNSVKNFVFSVVRDASVNKILIGASDSITNNSINSLPQDLETGDHYEVKKTGWHTFRSKLRSENGKLYVDMVLIDPLKKKVWEHVLGGTPEYDLASWSWNCNATFPIIYNGSTVNDPSSNLPPQPSGFDLPIDNHKLILYNGFTWIGPPVDKNECFGDGWKTFNWDTLTEPSFKSQGDCISFVESN